MKNIIYLLFISFSSIVFAQDKIVINKNETKLVLDESIENSIQSRAGHKNGAIDASERITFEVSLKAISGDFISTSANISCSNKNVKVITSKLPFEDMKQGTSLKSKTPLVVELNSNFIHNELIILNFEIVDSQKKNNDGTYKVFRDSFSFRVNKVGPVEYSNAIIDDDNIGQSKGDGDGVIEKLDKDIEIPLLLKNLGTPNITNVQVKIVSEIANIRFLEDTHIYNVVKGGSKYNSTPADYVFYIDERGPSSIDKIPMKLNIKGMYNGKIYNWQHSFKLGNSFGYLNLSNLDPTINVNINGVRKNKSKLKFMAGTKVNLSFSKSGFEPLNKTITIKEDKTTAVKVILKENATPTLDYIPLIAEKELIPLTTPNDYNSFKGLYDFYIEPAKNKLRKTQRRSILGNVSSFLLGSGIIALGQTYKDEDKKKENGNKITSGVLGGLFIFMSFAIKSPYKSISKNIDYNLKLKEKARQKARLKQNEYNRNQEKIAETLSKKRNEQIEIENLELKKTNEKIRAENNEINKKNNEITKKNNEIIKINNSKKAIFSYKEGNGKWISFN